MIEPKGDHPSRTPTKTIEPSEPPNLHVRSWVDLFVVHRRLLTCLVVAVSVLLFCVAPRIQMDPSLKSMLVTSSEPFARYQAFTSSFPDDDYVIVVIRQPLMKNVQSFLESVKAITDELETSDIVNDIVSVSNLKVFQKQRNLLGNLPLLRNINGRAELPDKSELTKIRQAIPLIDLLVSEDTRTVGILIRLKDESSFDVAGIQSFMDYVNTVVKRHLTNEAEFRVVGEPTLRLAVANYSYRTAVIYLILASVLCASVTVWVTKSLKVSILAMIILGVSTFWLMSFLGLMGYSLNPATSISFGLILITSLEIVIHMALRYEEFCVSAPTKEEAAKRTVRYLFKPFLFCTLTTAVGFGSCMITDVPMVFQLGFIMCVGVTVSFFLSFILAPAALFGVDFGAGGRGYDRTGDLASTALLGLRKVIDKRHRQVAIMGCVSMAILFAGVPFIDTDPQLLHQLGRKSREVTDLEWVATNLTSVHFLQIVLESRTGEGSFKNPEAWSKVKALEASLREMPEVLRTDSMLGIMEHVHHALAGAEYGSNVLSDPKHIQEATLLLSMDPQGRRLIQRHTNDARTKLRISVRIKNSPTVPVLETIQEIKRRADLVMGDTATSTITGELALLAEQGDELVKAQFLSMFIAMAIITVLLMAHMGTPLFGLVTLIPNIPPIAAVFGLMGWLDIPLDGVNIFAATVAVGLAVDNTVHFVSELKRQIKANPFSSVRSNVFRAHELAARPMASWSLVTAFGFLALAATPFHAAAVFGELVSVALLMGMFGDLLFMQSIIVTSPSIRNLIRRVVDKEREAAGA